MSPEEQEEDISSLASIFSDLEHQIVSQVYHATGCDYRRAQDALAAVAKDPSSLAFIISQAAQQAEEEDHLSPSDVPVSRAAGDRPFAPSASAGLAGLAALAMAPPPKDDAPYGLSADGSWDLSALTDTLANVGLSMTDGITSMATNITGWVADLAAAFDTDWQGSEEEQGELSQEQRDEAVAVRGVGGSERLNQRRQVGSGGNLTNAPSNRMEAEESVLARVGSEDAEGENEDWVTKDD
mmetsp:Transcript_10416/g.18142  ORF Transcript_10416/g.18142 Transcript_10416/m.18142 type:complete len:240 (-) Transcript_10416:1223-1942(-)|eukprot:CAMPEP_0119102046 /NCGR_PEP_ID=MMETSP1180-20130426/919_1 /TAXON_ID=3052 ORGANISM="Chlamydomonas cf sp, Strain CCMP681" /NCGR_SAMPLE_ID=MMETSP1180 /ASSEMBLY_ACC=CAM_ASM_000741 /LENGTH=239 /DNA_ID=CAMNT_0007086261 /DNA_START=39 /DNA_END=758 /DNA_ORIENTATION=+